MNNQPKTILEQVQNSETEARRELESTSVRAEVLRQPKTGQMIEEAIHEALGLASENSPSLLNTFSGLNRKWDRPDSWFVSVYTDTISDTPDRIHNINVYVKYEIPLDDIIELPELGCNKKRATYSRYFCNLPVFHAEDEDLLPFGRWKVNVSLTFTADWDSDILTLMKHSGRIRVVTQTEEQLVCSVLGNDQ